MNWTEITVSVPLEYTDTAAAIANMTVPYGIYIEDYSDLEQGAEEIAHIDLIDEELVKRDRTKSIIHIYISECDNAEESLAFLKERLTAEKIPFDAGASGVKDSDWNENWKKYFQSGSQDAVVSNPPFFKFHGNEELINDLDQLTLARHEISITLEEIIETAACLLKDKGYFAMVHRPDRFLEILDTMRKYSITPKKVRFCHSKIDKQAKILLVEGVKFGAEGLTVLPPLISHDDDGKYSKEVLALFD